MNCRKVSHRLSAYIEGDLSPKEIDRVEEHLKICSMCRRKLADVKLISQTAGQLEQKTPGPYFTSRLLCVINNPNNTIFIRSWRHRLTLSGAAFVLAASMTFVLIGPRNSTVLSPTADVNTPVETQPGTNTDKMHKGFPVSGEVLKRDMALTENPKPDSIVRDSMVLPKHYVQPVGVKKNNNDNVIF